MDLPHNRKRINTIEREVISKQNLVYKTIINLTSTKSAIARHQIRHPPGSQWAWTFELEDLNIRVDQALDHQMVWYRHDQLDPTENALSAKDQSLPFHERHRQEK